MKQKKALARHTAQDKICQLLVKKGPLPFSQICRALNRKLYDELNRHKAMVLYDLNRLQLAGRILKKEEEDRTVYHVV